MIRATLQVEHHTEHGTIFRPDYQVEGDDLAVLLPDAVHHILSSSFRPLGGETLVFLMPNLPVHVVGGFVVTHRVTQRTVRRACERLWPTGDPVPGVEKKAAWNLLMDKQATVRLSPFKGLTATRT